MSKLTPRPITTLPETVPTAAGLFIIMQKDAEGIWRAYKVPVGAFTVPIELEVYPPITENTTFSVAPAGGDFSEPGAATEYLSTRRIAPGVMVTIDVADGEYTCTKTIRGHIDGHRIRWTNNGLNGAKLVGADFAALDAMWDIDPITGQDATALAAAKVSAEAIVRAKYKVIFEFAAGIAMSTDNLHSGDWSSCPSLFINTAAAETGIMTGVARDTVSDGGSGTALVMGSCFFGFSNCNMVTRYGGVIQIDDCLSLFGGDECCRSDFAGGFFTGGNFILIGSPDHGWRGNHGGYFWAGSIYVRGCGIGIDADNVAMFRVHDSDIQYNRVGVSCSWCASGKVFNAAVKNNAHTQMDINNGGAIDARDVDAASTVLFNGLKPEFGVRILMAGSINLSTSLGTSEVTGNQIDIYLTGAAAAQVNGTVFDTAQSGSHELTVDPVTFLLTPLDYDPRDREGYAEVEVAGTTLTLPDPCPKVVGIVQPIGSAGTPITIDTIDFADFPAGDEVVLVAANAGTGETVLLNDSILLSLSAPSRRLVNVRDILTLQRATSAGVLAEKAFKRNQNNTSSDTRRVRVVDTAGTITATRDDDIIVVNKITPAATAVELEADMNFIGSQIIVKDGKGDAATNNITITPGGGKLIDGAASKVISRNYVAMLLVYNGTQWNSIIESLSSLGNVASMNEATAAEYRSGAADKVLTADVAFAAADFVALTDGANIAVNLATGINFTVTLGGNRTLDNPTNTKNGQSGVIEIVQDGTGSRTLAFGTNWEFVGGVAPILSTAAAAVDVLHYQVRSATSIRAWLSPDMK